MEILQNTLREGGLGRTRLALVITGVAQGKGDEFEYYKC